MSNKSLLSRRMGITDARASELINLTHALLPSSASIINPHEIIEKIPEFCANKEEAAWCSFMVTASIHTHGIVLNHRIEDSET